MAQNVIAADLADIEWSPDDVDGNYEVIVGCKTVGIPELSPEYRDRTSLDSPGRFKEYGVGLTDVSEVTLSCFYSAELYEKAQTYKASEVPVYFRVKLPPVPGVQTTGDTFVYTALVNPSVPAVDQDGDLMIDLKLRTSGALVWTKGTPV